MFIEGYSFVQLYEYDPEVGGNVLKNPDQTLSEFDEKLISIQSHFKDTHLIEKCNVHIRVYCLPPFPEFTRFIFPQNEDLGVFLQVSGTIKVTINTIRYNLLI